VRFPELRAQRLALTIFAFGLAVAFAGHGKDLFVTATGGVLVLEDS